MIKDTIFKEKYIFLVLIFTSHIFILSEMYEYADV